MRDRPVAHAFIAMAHWHLNNPEEARTALVKLQETVATDRWKDDDEARRLLEEVQVLLSQPLR